MEIILVGCGKVGAALARHLSNEGHSITVVDTDPSLVAKITENLDVMGLVGTGSSITTLNEAGLETADVLIAVTGSDELNLLCCLFARKVGHCQTIARVRNPDYSLELDFIKRQLGISAIINPELAASREISRLIRFPAATKIDTFAGGRVRMIKFVLTHDCGLDGVALKDIPARIGGDILICAVERGAEVVVPNGSFVLKAGDAVSFLATQDNAYSFFQKLKLPTRPAKSALIVGGGTIAYYLAKDLLAKGIRVRIVEANAARCEKLAEDLPGAIIINGDGTDKSLLLSEGLAQADSFISLTDLDEENVLLALFAKKHSTAKLVTKVNRLELDDIVDGLDLGSVLYPKYMTCDFIIQQVRAMQSGAGSNLKTLYRLLDDRVEALEFEVPVGSPVIGTPLAKLNLKKNLLICCITRGEQVIIPRGGDSIQAGDSVIVVSNGRGMRDVSAILAE